MDQISNETEFQAELYKALSTRLEEDNLEVRLEDEGRLQKDKNLNEGKADLTIYRDEECVAIVELKIDSRKLVKASRQLYKYYLMFNEPKNAFLAVASPQELRFYERDYEVAYEAIKQHKEETVQPVFDNFEDAAEKIKAFRSGSGENLSWVQTEKDKRKSRHEIESIEEIAERIQERIDV